MHGDHHDHRRQNIGRLIDCFQFGQFNFRFQIIFRLIYQRFDGIGCSSYKINYSKVNYFKIPCTLSAHLVNKFIEFSF